MPNSKLSVREITAEDVDNIADYWLQSVPEYYCSMGCDLTKFPSRSEWKEMLINQLSMDYSHKKSYCIIWLLNGQAVGHCNVNKIEFGLEAYMHLHIWTQTERKKGYGEEFVKLSLPYFFKNLKLVRLYCEPYSLNPAPNKILPKIGFEFVKSYRCIPGFLNFEQEVNLWHLGANNLMEIYNEFKQ